MSGEDRREELKQRLIGKNLTVTGRGQAVWKLKEVHPPLKSRGAPRVTLQREGGIEITVPYNQIEIVP